MFRSFKSKAAAKAWRRDALVEASIGTLTTARATPTLGEAFDDLLQEMRSGAALSRSGTPYRPGSIRTYAHQRAVWQELEHVRLHDLRRADVQRVVDRLRAEGRSASAIRNAVDPLRVIYRRAARADLTTNDPLAHLDFPAIRRKPIRVERAADPQVLLGALPDDLRALWATALYAGLRRGELRALRWTHVDLDVGVIRVARGWDDVEGEQETKSAAGVRGVPIVLPLRRELARHQRATKRTGGALVFGMTATRPFATSSVDTRSKEAFATAGIADPPTLHTARHATISRLIAAGLDAKVVQSIAGHSSIATTFDRYGHLFPDAIAESRDRLDAYLQRGG